MTSCCNPMRDYCCSFGIWDVVVLGRVATDCYATTTTTTRTMDVKRISGFLLFILREAREAHTYRQAGWGESEKKRVNCSVYIYTFVVVVVNAPVHDPTMELLRSGTQVLLCMLTLSVLWMWLWSLFPWIHNVGQCCQVESKLGSKNLINIIRQKLAKI